MREILKWVTISGQHIPIFKGENVKQRFSRFYKGKDYSDSKYEYLDEDDEDDEAYDKYVDMSDRCYDRLSSRERELIKDHYIKQEESYEINENLRNDKPMSGEQADTVRALDRACLSYKAENDMASIRFVDLNYLNNVYNVGATRDNKAAIAEKMKDFIGTEIVSKSFTSVSLNQNGNGMFNNLSVHMKVNIPKGTTFYAADNVGEYEAVLGRNTKLQLKKANFRPSTIKGLEYEAGTIELTYEVVKSDRMGGPSYYGGAVYEKR